MPEVPKNAKKPTDRQPKADEQVDLIEVDIRGVHLVIDANRLDDFELMDDIARAEDGDVSRAATILRKILDDEQRVKVLETARDKKTGRIGLEAGLEVVKELFEAANPNS